MKVEIYIHGAPDGQNFWSSGDADPVINQFYGAGGDEQFKYQAEVRNSCGKSFCYYSLLMFKNVSAESGRAGSYFGMTIRMDMFCKKILTLKKILENVFSIDVKGKILKYENKRWLFSIADFKEKAALCQSIEEKIMKSFDLYLEGSDFVAIPSAMQSGKSSPKVNISECDTDDVALAYMQKYGSVAISANYPSSQYAMVLKAKEDEMTALKLQCQQESQRIRLQADKDLQNAQQQANEAVRQAQSQSKREIEQINARYAESDRKMNSYVQQLEQMKRENVSLQEQLQKKEKETAKLRKINQDMDMEISRLKHGAHGAGPRPKSNSNNFFAANAVPFVTLLIVIAGLFVVYLRIPSDKSVKQISTELNELKEKMNSLTETPPAEEKSTIGETVIDSENTLQKPEAKPAPKVDDKLGGSQVGESNAEGDKSKIN